MAYYESGKWIKGLETGTAHKPYQRLSVFLMCGDGFYQRYLARRLYSEHDLCGIAVYKPTASKGKFSTRLLRLLNPVYMRGYLLGRAVIAREKRESRKLFRELFGKDDGLWPPDVDQIDVENINDGRTIKILREKQPDVVCVSGTNLIRKQLLALGPKLPYGFINLHTGLSPYSRGGNCNLFMLLEKKPEMVGVTVHHIDPGIDSGDIIISARPALSADDSYEAIDLKTFRLGIDLMLVALRQLTEKRAIRVPQWEKGKLFLKRTGYEYTPYYRYQVHKRLRSGLLAKYLSDPDAGCSIRLVGTAC